MNIKKSSNSAKNWQKKFEQQLHQKAYVNGNECMKRCSTSLVSREMHTPLKWLIWRRLTISDIDKDVEQLIAEM